MKYYKTLIVFLITLIFYQNGVFADGYYFDFKPVSRIPNSKNEYRINFLFLSQGNFIVRPVMKNPQGQIFIFARKEEISDFSSKSLIKKAGTWVSSYENWTLLPPLEKTMTIKILNAHEKSEIYFQIQNAKTGKIYLTPTKTLWPRNIIDDYFKKLNDNINARMF